MGLTTAMYSGLSGMQANQSRIATIGNNVANVNTTGFKASRTLFQTQFSELISAGSAPNANTGGVNPTQIGLGSLVATTQRNFSAGSIETTGVSSDLAIQGNGLFIVNRPDGTQLYSRDGSFILDANNSLVSTSGFNVQGFGVDSNYNIVPNVLTNLSIPLGQLTLAKATENAQLDGNLSASASIATQGSINVSQPLVDPGGSPATDNTQLTDLRAGTDPGVSLFAAGQVITLKGVTKGGAEMPPQTFTVGTDGNTLGDFATWMNSALGLQTGTDIPGAAGVTIVNGQLTITSNNGEPNAIGIAANNITTDNTTTPLPFTFTQTQAANGAGAATGFIVYDSLGNPVTVNATFTLDSTPNSGPVWRYYLESPDNQGGSRAIGSGLINFDTDGNFVSATPSQVTIDRSGTGAATPLTFNLDFSTVHGLSSDASTVIATTQDGTPSGTLNGFGIGPDGTITGTFSNGMTRTLGQVALATFANPEGLVAEAGNNYSVGPNSGQAVVTTAGSNGAGQILDGALELSNGDRSGEFIELVSSSTGFQAASRVISTTSDLMDQLLLIVR